MGDAEELRTLLPRCLLRDWLRLGARAVRLFRDHHHPDAHKAVLSRLLDRARASAALCEERRNGVPSVSYPAELPITPRKDEIVSAIRANRVVVIAGETGSGKTTQIPKMCLEAGLGVEGMIGCTQPRRVAALSISRRIAEELQVGWGREVGCKIRFDDRSSANTYIKLMTDGILLAETQGDPLLSDYNAIIIDEAHERSLNIDFLLGYLKGLVARRSDLKVIITSATIDTKAFSEAFGGAPIVEVSGRLYPVEVIYSPLEAASEEQGDVSYIEAAVKAAEWALCEPGEGDALLFMPGERDIRETADLLEGRLGAAADIIPLFGRLSSGDQQRVFAPSPRQKVVVATNIAETSLTIPGIRYVVDSGLARISRYNPRTRTKRLPVEPISQSSANQRKGRCGRVQNGVCIRLYSQEDFEARPPFTQPEIQRANLAEVILRMTAFQLGTIETFPFVDPPSPAAIQAGYKLLEELGALDADRQLTPLGRDLSRLPIDPSLGRMLLQSQEEHAARELLIIASGLSIQDPRERPADEAAAAAAAHKRFADPQSDFLTLLNIWNAVHDQWEALRTQNQRRKFCKSHFLSYIRMREWQDLHAQLHGALEDLGGLQLNESTAAYEAIHRSVLAGLLGHVAARTERNLYRAAGNRQVMVFPGSSLFARSEDRKKPRTRKEEEDAPRQEKSHQPEWIVAGEIVETSQLFARTVAGIDPQWIVRLAPHLCKTTYHHPHWSAASGRVLAEEKTLFNGFEIQSRRVAYGNINPEEAAAIFIRSALVEEDLLPEQGDSLREPEGASSKASVLRLAQDAAHREAEAKARYPFLEHNRKIRHKIETWQTRTRRRDLGDIDERLFRFYGAKIRNVSSLHELDRLIRDEPNPEFLHISEADLTGGQDISYDAEAFPDAVTLESQPVSLNYAYAPGEDWDGVTLRLDAALARSATPASVAWSVPGLREEQIAALLQSLPKALRRVLMPFPPKIQEIVRELRPTGGSLAAEVGRFIHKKYGVEIPADAWRWETAPAHVRPRIEVVGGGKVLASGRDLETLRESLPKTKPPAAQVSSAWQRAARQWERFGLTSWNFGDLPDRVSAGEELGLPVYGWPGLEAEGGAVNIKLYRTAAVAKEASLAGMNRLLEIALEKDLGWLQKDLRSLARFNALYAPLGPGDELQETAFSHLKSQILPSSPPASLTCNYFTQVLGEARERLREIASPLIDAVGAILDLRQQIAARTAAASPPAKRPQLLSDFAQLTVASPPSKSSPGVSPIRAELDRLLPARFLEATSAERLKHLPRFLKALLIRAERAAVNPAKDSERTVQLAPYVEALRRFEAAPPRSQESRALVEEFRWMVDEFRVSLFAQELGTAIPVSAKRLDQHLEKIKQAPA